MRRIAVLPPGLIVVFVVALQGMGSMPAEGGITITQTKVQEIADPTFTYTFTVEIDDDCALTPGNYFTIFDLFAPSDTLILDGSDHPPTTPSPFWAITTPPFGPSPFPSSPFDTDLLNVAWIYFGPVITGPTVLGDFTVTIEQPVAMLPTVHFVSECGPPGSSVVEEGEVTVTVVPEPATLASALCGIGLLAIGRRRRRRRSARS